jgi:hypothetical protein
VLLQVLLLPQLRVLALLEVVLLHALLLLLLLVWACSALLAHCCCCCPLTLTLWHLFLTQSRSQ